MAKKTPPKGIATKQETKVEPLVIEGSIKYKITVDDEGYFIESERSIQNDLACIMLSKDITEKIITDYKLRKSMNGDTKMKQMVTKRMNKLIEASAGITIMSTDILLTILSMVRKDK
jgi:hypothetical protein